MTTALQSRVDCCLLSATDPADRRLWSQTLAKSIHDVYHLPAYAQLDAMSNGGRAVAFFFADGSRSLLVPLVVRSTPKFVSGFQSTRENESSVHRSAVRAGRPSPPALESASTYDAASPYGFPGPTISGSHGAAAHEWTEFLQEAAQQFGELLSYQNIISVFLRFHPLLPHQVSFAEAVMAQQRIRSRPGLARIVTHGESVYCDLSLSDEEMWRQTRRRDRSYINKARRGGFRFEFDHEWSGLDDFVEMYYATMRRVGASEYYFFPREYFCQFRDGLGSKAHLVFVLGPDGERVCGAILTTCGAILQYHLAGTHGSYREWHPSKFLIDQARRWGKKNGLRWLHLGGGVGGTTDSLLHFKSGFSKLRSTFRSFRLVVDSVAYRELTEQSSGAKLGSDDDLEGYFPAYRNPTLPSETQRHTAIGDQTGLRNSTDASGSSRSQSRAA